MAASRTTTVDESGGGCSSSSDSERADTGAYALVAAGPGGASPVDRTLVGRSAGGGSQDALGDGAAAVEPESARPLAGRGRAAGGASPPPPPWSCTARGADDPLRGPAEPLAGRGAAAKPAAAGRAARMPVCEGSLGTDTGALASAGPAVLLPLAWPRPAPAAEVVAGAAAVAPTAAAGVAAPRPSGVLASGLGDSMASTATEPASEMRWSCWQQGGTRERGGRGTRQPQAVARAPAAPSPTSAGRPPTPSASASSNSASLRCASRSADCSRSAISALCSSRYSDSMRESCVRRGGSG